MRALVIVWMTCIVVWAEAVQAQMVTPRFEVGGSAGAMAGGGRGDAFMILTLGPRLTFNATPRDAIEVFTEIVGPVESDGLHGLYLLQYKRILTDRVARRSHVFMTAGVGGAFEYHRANEFREERPDGSVFVVPPHTRASLSEPFLVVVGIGTEHVLARYIAIRGDVQLVAFRFGVGARATVGASVPIGGYRDR